MRGYIALHRKSIDNPLYFDGKFDKWHAWSDLLLLASYKDTAVVVKGVSIDLKPGQLCWAQKSLYKRWGWSYERVRRFLQDLQQRRMIDLKTNKVTTIISIVNWDNYQSPRPQTEMEQDRKQDLLHDPGRDTNNKTISNKEINNNNYKEAKSVNNYTRKLSFTKRFEQFGIKEKE